MRPRVVFLVAHAKNYRVAFWNHLHAVLASDGIDLRVVYGCPNTEHSARLDNAVLPPEYGRKVPSYWLGERFVLHAAWHELAKADLVITQNENKLLLNAWLLSSRDGGARRVAFWGKGNIEPAAITNPAEWFRYKTAFAVDWWFPYTKSTAANLRSHGVRCGITPVGNAIDTSELRRDMASISTECVLAGRRALGLGRGPVGVFCGNLSPNKDLPLLFEASRLVQESIPDFHLVVIGNGPQREYVEKMAIRHRFIHYMGPRVGRQKALLLRMAEVFLLPGAVGLAILDSFAAGLPLLSTRRATHGPEISYLQEGINGLMSLPQAESFATTTVQLLNTPAMIEHLRNGAIEASTEYSVESMVENFRQGILLCLGQSHAAINRYAESFSDPAPESVRGES